MAAKRYRIVLRGRLSEHFESAFDGMTLEHGPNRTVLVGDVRDQAQLYGLLDRLQEFGIELLAVEPANVSDGGSEPGAGRLTKIRPAAGRTCRRRARWARRLAVGCGQRRGTGGRGPAARQALVVHARVDGQGTGLWIDIS